MVILKFFAQSAKIMGKRELKIVFQPDKVAMKLGDLLNKESEKLSLVIAHTGNWRLAVNQEFADLETPIHDGDEIAFIPPVSGG